MRRLRPVLIAATLASWPVVASAQAVSAPALTADDLRARLSRAIVGQPMPTDVAALDAMVARDDGAALSRRLAGVSDGAQAELDLNWERDRLFNGAGFLVAFAYMTDLWRVGTALPGRQGDQIKQSAALYFVYAIDLVRLDGVRCADATAPEHRRRQLFAQNQPLVAFLRGLPRSTRMTIGSLSLAWESATATRRRDDPVLCADGMESMTAGLKAAGDAPLRHVPNAPGTFGRTYAVPPAPGYRPRFVPAAQSMAEQADRRRALPAYLTSFLTVPGDSASVPPPAPPGR